MTETLLFDRSDWSKIELAGPEARTFLHNLCTNNVKDMSAGAGCEAFLTTPKARVVGHFFAGNYERAGQSVLWLDAAPGQAAKLLQTFDHYLISEQVELADRTDELKLFTIYGPAAFEICARIFGGALENEKPLHHRKVELDGSPLFLRRQTLLNLPGVDLFMPPSESAAVQQKLLDAGAVAGDHELFEILRVESGFPLFGVDIDENRLVMEVGRTAQAISYTKGCFLGQEPIVMARDRGQVNRTLLGVKASDGEPLPAGTKLWHGEVEAGQTSSSVRSPRFGVIALAYLRRGCQDTGLELRVEADGSRTAIVSPLPFQSN